MGRWSPEGYQSIGCEILDKIGDGRIDLAWSGGEVENLHRNVGRKKKKNKIIFNPYPANVKNMVSS